MFQTPPSGNKKALAQPSSEAGTSRQDTTSPIPEATQATDSRCSSPDLDAFMLAMTPDEIDELNTESTQTKSKAKPKAKKAEKPPSKSLPVQASSVKDVRSMNNVINTLARQIINAIREGKSVTSGNKKYIIEAAEEICLASDIYLSSILEPDVYGLDPPPDPPAASPPNVDSVVLREELVSVMREEMSRFKAEIKEELASPSYAQVAANSTQPPPVKPPKSTYKPAIVVTPIESSDDNQPTIKKFKKSISFRNKNYAPTRVKAISNNKVRVEFVNESQCQETLNQLKESDIVSAEPAKKLRPMLILKGVSNDIPLEDLTSIITLQNPSISELIKKPDDLKFRFKRNNNRNPSLYNAVYIVDPAIWREAIHLGRINVDHQKVFVGDFSPFIQCYKCLQFGHLSKNCLSDCRPCSHCADTTHQVSTCPDISSDKSPQCFNCSKYNKKTNSKLNTEHSATSPNCPTILYMSSQIKSKIDYSS